MRGIGGARTGRFAAVLATMLWLLCPAPVPAQEQGGEPADAAAQPPAGAAEPLEANVLETLGSFIELRDDLLQDIGEVNREIGAARTDAERQALQPQLDKLEADLRAVRRNFENIAAGTDLSVLRAEQAEEFNFQKELYGLLKPALDEMRSMTSHVRQKSELREKIAGYEQRLPVVESALANVERLQAKSDRERISQALEIVAEEWRKQQALISSELQGARLQLEKLESSEVSLGEASRSYLKSFFQKRGLYLTEALLAVAGILFLSRLSLRAMQRYLPGFRRKHRSFRVRLAELVHRIVTMLLVIIGPMVVFYIVEDWVLFSLGILLLIGIAWTLRQTLPRYIKQIQLFLNVGSVREGERIQLDGLPWKVEQINVFSTLVNPTAELSQRVPIDSLVGLKSRAPAHDEPWFPCRKGDWVILRDGVRGKVVAISPEMVQLVERGGALSTYQLGDFLAASPRNLATNFRIKETIGVSYALQQDVTGRIPEILYAFIQRRLDEEGYADKLLNLRVEFEKANTSSLDLVVIADFAGELGDLYNRLRRAVQRWCVDACTEHGWEIPFPQLTLHGEVASRG